jgi:arginine utilization regulatory protein
VDDIPLLAYHFLGKYRGNRKPEHIDPQALKALQSYKWPGNVRELEHIIEHALSMAEGDTIRITDLPEDFLNRVADRVATPESWMSAPFGEAKDEFEKLYITRILEESNWNISEASRRAQMFRQNLQQKIRKYGIKVEDEKEGKKEEP